MALQKHPGRRGPRIWVILHCEVVLTLDGWLVDEDVFFTASSIRLAERLIRSSRVEPGSWWHVECARLNDIDGTRAKDRVRPVYYTSTGRKIPAPLAKQGYHAAILRDRRAAAMVQKSLDSASREGLSKKVIGNLRRTLQSMRKVLAHHE